LLWRVHVLVGGLVGLLLITAITTGLVLLRFAALNTELSGTWRPARASSLALAQGYADMETGERGFLLTRDAQFLQPYDSGRENVASAWQRLEQLFIDDPESTRLLRAAEDAGRLWQITSAESDIAAARGQSPTNPVPISAVLNGKRLFDDTRTKVAALQAHLDLATNSRVQARDGTQVVGNVITLLAAVVAILIGAGAVVLLRRSLVVPLNRLISQVQQVSGGDLASTVNAGGPKEITTLSTAVEAMRQRILAENATLRQQRDEIRQLSTPVIQVWDKVLVVPIIGNLDSGRAGQLTESLLGHIADLRPEVIILDISGLSTVDTDVVQHLFTTVQAATLMGADSVVSGVRPDTARAIMNLDIDMQRLHYRNTLRDALQLALQIMHNRTGAPDLAPAANGQA
jgi:anti-anti-sigma regulatory factor/CHASE3 domain sensor protein